MVALAQSGESVGLWPRRSRVQLPQATLNFKNYFLETVFLFFSMFDLKFFITCILALIGIISNFYFRFKEEKELKQTSEKDQKNSFQR